MNWDTLMDADTQRSVISQLSAAYSFNKSSPKSVPMTVTSVGQRWHELFHRVNGFQWSKQIVSFTKASVIEGMPIGDLIYLTPDASEVCTELDRAKAYVVPCLIGPNAAAGAPRDFAVAHGIPTQRLPIPEFVRVQGPPVLPIDCAVGVVVRVANGAGWRDALRAAIPVRKSATEANGEGLVREPEPGEDGGPSS
jgi:hypothetical protein